MIKKALPLCLFILVLLTGIKAQNPERTCFQTARAWQPELDLRSDVAIVYGVNASFAARVQSWRERGYGVHMMTGAAWGGYQDYFEGRFDGKTHFEDGQVDQTGKVIWHGPNVPYVVPTEPYLEYLKSLIKTAIDVGVTAIHLEEPEFWNRAGYSEGFKREWQAYYDEPWQAQHESPSATYLSNKLKHHLYQEALRQLIQFAKTYATQQGKTVECYVPTHSLLNYSTWHIVSPEADLAQIPGLDGYIGQVWTGTARVPNYYNGIHKERTFETAFLEYGSVAAMTRSTGKRVYFLTDPIEDNPDYTWENYKLNYEATFAAQLMYPEISHFEVMPWPGRIFLQTYKIENATERQKILPSYATEILVLINCLNDMAQQEVHFPGTGGIAVVQSNTMMFQSFPTHADYSDPALANFYGMALPLLKHGIPVEIIQLENLENSRGLTGIRVLILSYANMKPLKPGYHRTIADWVTGGGLLLYAGRDNDPYQKVPEWWNKAENHYDAPSQHLFEMLKIAYDHKYSEHRVGNGRVIIIPENPGEFILQPGRSVELRNAVHRLYQQSGLAGEWQEKNFFHIKRGPYEIISVLTESSSDTPYSSNGHFIDLFDPSLPILTHKIIKPGQRAFLYDLTYQDWTMPVVIAAASRVSDEIREKNRYQFCLKGPDQTNGIARIFVPGRPKSMSVQTSDRVTVGSASEWDPASRTVVIQYPNKPEGIWVNLDF